MSLGRDVVAIVSSRFTLGLCCIVLTIALWTQVNQNEAQSAEQECRDRIDADLLVEIGLSLHRLETAWALNATGDEFGAAAAAAPTEAEADAYERAIDRRVHAVSICAGGG